MNKKLFKWTFLILPFLIAGKYLNAFKVAQHNITMLEFGLSERDRYIMGLRESTSKWKRMFNEEKERFDKFRRAYGER
jgi:hypothetical protein